MKDRDAIASARTEFINAWNSRHVDAAIAYLAEEHVSMPPDRPSLRGRDAVRAFWRKQWAEATSKLAVRPERLKIVSDLGVDEVSWSLEASPKTGGSGFHDEGKCVFLWRRQSDGSWKLARTMWASDVIHLDPRHSARRSDHDETQEAS